MKCPYCEQVNNLIPLFLIRKTEIECIRCFCVYWVDKNHVGDYVTLKNLEEE